MSRLDNILTYSTPKIVEIRDKRLALLHYTMLLIIFLYIVVYQIVLQGKWYGRSAISGTVSVSLRDPPNGVPPLASLPYCVQNGSAFYNGFPTRNCSVQDATDVVYPPLQSRAISITTRITQSRQDDMCPDLFDECPKRYHTLEEFYYYLAGVELYSLLFQHSVVASDFYAQRLHSARGNPSRVDNSGITGSYLNMAGRLLAQDGAVLRVYNPVPHSPHNLTAISLQELLAAASVSLDEQSVSPMVTTASSFRDDGMVLHVNYYYTNLRAGQCSFCRVFLDDTIRYDMTAQLVPETEFKVMSELDNFSLNKRWLYNRHGVRVVITQTGDIYAFQFDTMLIALVSSLALTKAASILVDFIATRLPCFPQRHHYSRKKYENVDKHETRSLDMALGQQLLSQGTL